MCSIGRRGPAGLATLAIVAIALLVVARRRRRQIVVLLAMVALVSPGRARACSPIGSTTHVTDPAMVGVDQTPPVLAQPVVSDIGRGEGEGCISSSKCRNFGSVTLTNLATDDMTAAEEIGYRVTVVGGAAPPGFWQPTEAVRC